MKNLLVTYVGMFFGGDYIFSAVNFVGINISVVGSIIYSYYVFAAKERLPKVDYHFWGWTLVNLNKQNKPTPKADQQRLIESKA